MRRWNGKTMCIQICVFAKFSRDIWNFQHHFYVYCFDIAVNCGVWRCFVYSKVRSINFILLKEQRDKLELLKLKLFWNDKKTLIFFCKIRFFFFLICRKRRICQPFSHARLNECVEMTNPMYSELDDTPAFIQTDETKVCIRNDCNILNTIETIWTE